MQRYNYFDIHTHRVQKDRDVLAIQNIRIGVDAYHTDSRYISCGVHPYDTQIFADESINLNINDSTVVAVGEIGLDFRREVYNENQLRIFEQQILIALKAKLPIVIHSVKSHDAVLRLLRQHSVAKAIFHGFNNNLNIAKSILKHGYGISFGAKMLKNNLLISVMNYTLINHSDAFFLETDDSSINIKDLYDFTCNELNIKLSDLQLIIKNNIVNYFERIELE